MVKIAVIGGGINGVASAVKIKEAHANADVVVISNEFTPYTTGDGSGGLWYPYCCGDTPEGLLLKWGIATYKLYHKLWLEGGFNITLIPIYNMYKEASELQCPKWAPVVFGYRLFTKIQLKYYNALFNNEFRSGATFTTFVVYPSSILEYFMERFKRANGKFLRGEVASLDDPLLRGYDVVVNCTGLGSRNLVPDSAVFPVRGQIAKVLAPWVNSVVIDEDIGYYIIPNEKNCVLGGTRQVHNYSTQLNDEDAAFIIKGCSNIIPGLKNAQLVKQWAGLRPGRSEVRLEAEERDGKLIIHNYGHGGSGLTLFWGCAEDVLGLLNKNVPSLKKSKL